ncbi:hypothetical protein [Nocardioides litoris]|uniref:hypothetical protein n=1 Tax=Nocardioides litoris TaxID=1926648 RepID=UPI00111F9E14|nr:hypothetical protein [Nocardioides litoris]
MTSHPRTVLRRTASASAALVLGLSLAACGGGDDDSDADNNRSSSSSAAPTSDAPSSEATSDSEDGGSGAVPTEADLEALLLTPADLPAGFTPQADDGEDGGDADDGPFGDTCLGDVGEFSDALGSDPDEEAETDLGLQSDSGQTTINSQVEAYADAGAVLEAFATFKETLAQCTSVQTTDDDGVTIDLQITVDDSTPVSGASDQAAIEASGTITAGGQQVPVVFQLVAAPLLDGRFVSVVGGYVVGQDAASVLGTLPALAETQASRVVDAFA